MKDMAVQTKKHPRTDTYRRLRLREWMMFWILIAFTILLIVTIFEDIDINICPTVTSSATQETR